MGRNTFTYEERQSVENGLKDGLSHTEIGKRIGRSKGGIFYEINRGRNGDLPYSADYAHERANQIVPPDNEQDERIRFAIKRGYSLAQIRAHVHIGYWAIKKWMNENQEFVANNSGKSDLLSRIERLEHIVDGLEQQVEILLEELEQQGKL